MEQNKKHEIFEIICDDEIFIIKAINIYNKTYLTDFKLLEYVLDEVNFAKISGTVYLSDIFQLGSLYGRLSKDVS
ncbi:MAG: hypothetical protein SGJ10_02375 [Bacteroidota bacterium]|nr:hypothetical protein [Bacteroidota bacterium]